MNRVPNMIIFKKSEQLTAYLLIAKAQGKQIGFVPTMGALHDGHLSLISQSKEKTQLTVCSIFVNPTQFTNPEDFKNYPITIESDIEKLVRAGCDVLFIPTRSEVYPADHIKRHYELGEIENLLEGKYRPGHFQGVCEVVERLLMIVQPDQVFLGQKDYQQCMVLTKLVELLGLKETVNIQLVPTMREADGLAMSSRNLRLNSEQRKKASSIHKCLSYIKENISKVSPVELQEQAIIDLTEKGFIVDYVAIVNAKTLQPLGSMTEPKVALVAASLDSIRLIDNTVLD